MKISRPIHKEFFALVSLVVVCLGLAVPETQAKTMSRAFDDFVLDNKNHYLPCTEPGFSGSGMRLMKTEWK